MSIAIKIPISPLKRLPVPAVLAVLLWLSACGPAKEEGWSSYYYGTGRASSVYYDKYPADNDDAYRLPQGYWEDNQIPQGQKW